jgi:hypothetical protein
MGALLRGADMELRRGVSLAASIPCVEFAVSSEYPYLEEWPHERRFP